MLADNYNQVSRQIREAAARSGRSPHGIKLIAVTKTVGPEKVREAIKLGITDFGENRVQEASEKVTGIREVKWHFIGHLQSNKAKDVLPHYTMIHSLDRFSLARTLQNCAERFNLEAKVLLQVNVSGEKSKFGLNPEAVSDFIDSLAGFDRLKLCGLMTMAPYVDDPEETRAFFRELRVLRDRSVRPGLELPELSMGMTNDFVVAVEEGATMVRIGSALFN